LRVVPAYADYVDSSDSGGFEASFGKGNGWTPNIAVDFGSGSDIKTVNSWRDGWDGGDGANYLLDGDIAEPYIYLYRFVPRNRAGVLVISFDLDGLGESRNRVDWKIYAGSRAGSVLAEGTTGEFSGVSWSSSMKLRSAPSASSNSVPAKQEPVSTMAKRLRDETSSRRRVRRSMLIVSRTSQ